VAEQLERDYECERCGIRAIVIVEGQRVRTPFRRRANRRGPRLDDELGTQDDASQTLGLTACPGCGRRPGFALGWSVLRTIACGIGGAVASLYVGPSLFWIAFGLATGAATGAAIELRRWRSAGRVRVIRELRPPHHLPLPTAIATRALPVPMPEPRPAPKPAPPLPPPDPAGGPRLLK
jgi:hypothetical protein